jgi:hypothetical protein
MSDLQALAYAASDTSARPNTKAHRDTRRLAPDYPGIWLGAMLLRVVAWLFLLAAVAIVAVPFLPLATIGVASTAPAAQIIKGSGAVFIVFLPVAMVCLGFWALLLMAAEVGTAIRDMAVNSFR